MGDVSVLGDAPILAAEFHYFRASTEFWPLALTRLRQMGVNTVSSYVPWVWHEPRPGLVDFSGATDPRRDLIGFIHLCQSLGFRLILKPGPFVDAELLGGGIPPWLLQQHPAIHAVRADGQLWRHSDSAAPRACYLHPTYLAAARTWIAAFSTVAAPFQFPAGPVIAVQVDNETPGDGLLPADAGLDPRLRLDYNSFVVEQLWPRFLGAEAVDLVESDQQTGELAQEYPDRRVVLAHLPAFTPDPGHAFSHPPALPRTIAPPATIDELRQYQALELFTDWFYAEAVAVVARWLRDAGWRVPLFHDLLAAPWQRCGTIVDMPALARATDWLGFNVYAEDVTEPFVGGAGYVMSFEEYVHYGFWRPRLAASLSSAYPVLVPEISAAQDFYFATPLMGGAQAINVYVAHQAAPDHPAAGAYPRWAMEAPLRPDGSVRRRFWNVKTIFMLLDAAGADFAAARVPADIAIGYSHVPERLALYASAAVRDVAIGGDTGRRAQELAQRLVRASIAFHALDLDSATPEQLAAYSLVLAPAAAMMARDTQRKLAACANVALVGEAHPVFDEHLEPCDLAVTLERPDQGEVPLRLPETISAEWIISLTEQRGGYAQYGWADGPDVDVTVRHGACYTYVQVANRRAEMYNGTLTYRVDDGTLQHLHVGIGGPRIGVVLLIGDNVVGCAVGGDASEGSWLIRGMSSSIMFNGGAGAVAPCGGGLRFSAPQSGRFQVRRPEGWAGLAPWRLLLNGELLPAVCQIEGMNLTLPYVAEDERGITESYLFVADALPVEQLLVDLRTLLLARARMLHDAAALAPDSDPTGAAARQALNAAAAALEQLAGGPIALAAYAAAWQAATAICEPAIGGLARDLARARGAYLAGALAEEVYRASEAWIGAVLEAVARASLRVDEE